MVGIRIMRTGIHSKADFLKYVGSKAAISSFVGKDEITYVGTIKDLSLDGNYLILDNAYNEKSIIGLLRNSFVKKQRVQLVIKNIDMIEIRDRNVTSADRNIRDITHPIAEKTKSIMKKCLMLIESILLLLFVLFYLSELFPSFSNYVSNYYSTPEILGATPYEMSIVSNALNNTDKNVVRSIKSITVVTSNTLTCESIVRVGTETAGCAEPVFSSGGDLLNARIRIISKENYGGSCGTFEHTLYHEIGHVVDAYYNGNYENKEKEEQYAENYADTHSKDKCSTEEYKKLEFDMQEANRSIDELNTICNEKRKILSRWDKYGTPIPYSIYDQYLQDYNSYDYCITEYNNKIYRYNDLIKEEDRLLERSSERISDGIQTIEVIRPR